MGGVSPDAWSSEGPAPAAIAPEPTERPSERLAALRASSALHEFVDPGVAGLADVRAFRFLEDRPEFRRRREVSRGSTDASLRVLPPGRGMRMTAGATAKPNAIAAAWASHATFPMAEKLRSNWRSRNPM